MRRWRRYMTTLTSDKRVGNLCDALITTPDGLRHYAILVEALPALARFDAWRDRIPFYVALCALCDAYDAARSYNDFTYPKETHTAAALTHGFPTCVRCSGA